MFDFEQWETIKDFPRYSVSNYGRVKSQIGKEEIILKPNIVKGYEFVKLYRYDRNKFSECKLLSVHRLVAQYFCENYSEKIQVHHKDKNTRNNNFKNLICLTEEQHLEIHSKQKNKGGH